jgi:hypothetical protein
MRRGMLLGLVAVLVLATASPAFARRGRFRRMRQAPVAIQTTPLTPAPENVLRASPAAAERPPTPAELADVARAIHEVRAQRGSVLDGTLLDSPTPQAPLATDAVFFDAIAAAAGVKTASSIDFIPDGPAVSEDSMVQMLCSNQKAELDGRMQFPNSPVWVSLLRAEARRLSEEADEFEAVNRFSTADGLRARADQLRRLAREYFPARPNLGRCVILDESTEYRVD